MDINLSSEYIGVICNFVHELSLAVEIDFPSLWERTRSLKAARWFLALPWGVYLYLVILRHHCLAFQICQWKQLHFCCVTNQLCWFFWCWCPSVVSFVWLSRVQIVLASQFWRWKWAFLFACCYVSSGNVLSTIVLLLRTPGIIRPLVLVCESAVRLQ